ncbi:hypothetical protein F441_00163, partial [Phytophthora nicotianae CJ01A1]
PPIEKSRSNFSWNPQKSYGYRGVRAEIQIATSMSIRV